ncbi:MAG: hypothetical protein L0219_04350, partial [Phycisphaerales bacterium]|nr:hypothetical protein [Phycisphaerales bacterium]
VQISPVLYSRKVATFPEIVIPYYSYFSFVRPGFALGREPQRLLEEFSPGPVCRYTGDQLGRGTAA